MKNIFKILFIVLIIFIINLNEVHAIKKINIINKNDTVEIYEVKDKEEVILEGVLKFYETSDKNINLKEETVKEDETIEENIVEEIETQPVVVQPPQVVIEENDTIKNNVVAFALQYVGYPYVYGGNSLTTGTDCSGFIKLVFDNFGISLPRTTSAQAVSGMYVNYYDIKPGDIVSYGYNGQATHSALYIGNNQIIHASTPELGIRIDNLYIMPILSIRRVV